MERKIILKEVLSEDVLVEGRSAFRYETTLPNDKKLLVFVFRGYDLTMQAIKMLKEKIAAKLETEDVKTIVLGMVDEDRFELLEEVPDGPASQDPVSSVR